MSINALLSIKFNYEASEEQEHVGSMDNVPNRQTGYQQQPSKSIPVTNMVFEDLHFFTFGNEVYKKILINKIQKPTKFIYKFKCVCGKKISCKDNVASRLDAIRKHKVECSYHRC